MRSVSRTFMLGLLGLVGCSGGPPPTKTVYNPVYVKAPVSCVPPTLRPAPEGLETRSSLLAVPEGPQRYTRMASDWLSRVGRMEETEPVVTGCRKTAPPP